MAGIGFELKKLFHRRGLMAMLRAYGYAGVICAAVWRADREQLVAGGPPRP